MKMKVTLQYSHPHHFNVPFSSIFNDLFHCKEKLINSILRVNMFILIDEQAKRMRDLLCWKSDISIFIDLNKNRGVKSSIQSKEIFLWLSNKWNSDASLDLIDLERSSALFVNHWITVLSAGKKVYESFSNSTTRVFSNEYCLVRKSIWKIDLLENDVLLQTLLDWVSFDCRERSELDRTKFLRI